MKNWCQTNNILQVYSWGCLDVQVMFHALVTSSITPPGHKVGHILKLISPSIFELQRRSKARNANGYLAALFEFRYNFR